jgi:hypothetical protein
MLMLAPGSGLGAAYIDANVRTLTFLTLMTLLTVLTLFVLMSLPKNLNLLMLLTLESPLYLMTLNTYQSLHNHHDLSKTLFPTYVHYYCKSY